MPKPGSLMGLFRNQTFAMLWFASLASNFGGLVQAVGAAWMMTELTSSESMVALVQTSVTLPIMVFSLIAGVFADNFDRRKVMLVAQGFMLVVSIVLTVLALEGLLSPWLLLSFTFLIGCGTALHNPSWQASMGDIVSREELPAAVSLNSMGFNIMRSVGPAAGGAIVAIEEVGERPYRIDRALTQLLASGSLRGVAGVAVGQLHGCEEPAGGGSRGWTAGEVMEDRLARLGVPVVTGFAFGHTPGSNAALPFGVRARLDADAGALEILEPLPAS